VFIKFIFTLCTVAFAVGTVSAQSPKPELLGKFSDGDILEFNYRIANRLALSGEKTRVVLRICSQDDILPAIALSAGIGVTGNEEIGINAGLKRYHCKGEVFYAVYSGCKSRNERFNTVEYWLVGNGVKLDVNSEIPVDGVRFVGSRPTTTAEFDSILQKPADCDTNAANFIIGDYISAPSMKMRQNVEKAERALNSNAKCGTWSAAFVKSSDIYESEPEEDFPVFVSVSRKFIE